MISAFLGVVAGNWSASRRETVSRLWERRTEVYLDLMSWARSVTKAVETDGGAPLDNLPAERYQGLDMPDELATRVWAFASQSVLYAEGPARNHLFLLAQGADKTPNEHGYSDYDEYRYNLSGALGALQRVIRNELSSGTLREPMAFRVSQWVFPIKFKVRMYRKRRRLRRAPQREITSEEAQ